MLLRLKQPTLGPLGVLTSQKTYGGLAEKISFMALRAMFELFTINTDGQASACTLRAALDGFDSGLRKTVKNIFELRRLLIYAHALPQNTTVRLMVRHNRDLLLYCSTFYRNLVILCHMSIFIETQQQFIYKQVYNLVVFTQIILNISPSALVNQDMKVAEDASHLVKLENCKKCYSKLHSTEMCQLGYRCRMCGRFGHHFSMCWY